MVLQTPGTWHNLPTCTLVHTDVRARVFGEREGRTGRTAQANQMEREEEGKHE